MRLDRFISNHTDYGNQKAKQLVASGRVSVNSEVVRDNRFDVSAFSEVAVDGRQIYARKAHYFMLNKPKGYLSATKDKERPTVIDLFNEPFKHELHYTGRLDFNTTGLMLMTNDGNWSRRLSLPDSKVSKTYLVKTEKAITTDYHDAFHQGIYLPYEGVTTKPAKLELLDSHTARLTITEGKYHQVKRMFGAMQNSVVELHRESIGDLTLDEGLAVGEYRALTEEELALLG